MRPSYHDSAERRSGPALVDDGIPVIRIPRSAATPEGALAWMESDEAPRGVPVSLVDGGIRIDLRPLAVATIPMSAFTSDGFVEWADTADCPQKARITLTDKELIFDMSPEEIEHHLKVKTEIHRSLDNMNRKEDLGELLGEGALLRNVAAGINTVPEAMFALWETLESGCLRRIRRRRRAEEVSRMEGTPDWVLEVISNWSEHADAHEMRSVYHRAGIREYWMVDARGAEIDFRILVWRRTRYVVVRPRDGWYSSPIFGHDFKLTRRRCRDRSWQYTLHVR
jgi:Uma2 family endonuclease